MKCVIMAGGRGTRISSLAENIPKPMIRIAGKPVLEYQIETLREQGITDIMITVGYLGSVIMDYFGDGSGYSQTTGKPFDVHIEYYVEEKPLGNAGALFLIKDRLTDNFLLINGDLIFDIDFNRFFSFHKEKGGAASVLTHPNSHPYDSGIIMMDDRDAVTGWITKEEEHPNYYQNRVNSGIHILSKKILDQKVESEKIDLDRHILKPLAGTGRLFAYRSSEYVKDMGTPDRFYTVCKDIEHKRVKKRNLKYRQKAIFLDRDGTLNKYVGFLKGQEELELLPRVGEALGKINNTDYLAIVVTNQPAIARGELDFEKLGIIHNKLETLLGREGAYLDKMYFCPHHPDRGYEGERIEYKRVCDCRKPNPGMLFKAAEEFNLKLSDCWMIGDSESDIKAGKAAGCRTALIGEKDVGQDVSVGSLYEFVELLQKIDGGEA